MEFSWGRNVTEYGLGSMGVTLASRLPGTFRVVTNGTHPAFPGFHVEAYLSLNPDTPILTSLAPNNPGHPHFPYGIPVEPNVPA